MSNLIHDALTELNITGYSCYGTPTNETEFNEMFRKVTSTDGDGNITESDDPTDFGVTWSQLSTKLTELTNAQGVKLLREERDHKLAETDWWASSDLTMTTAQTNYRQALRDITNTYTSLDDVVWPTKPQE